MTTKSLNNIIWIDLEMTGLCTFSDEIIEIATVITDSQLNVIAEGPVIAIYQSNERLLQMDNWNQTQHRKSGLYERVLQSTYSVEEAEKLTLEFIEQYAPKNASPMAGNSICQDRRFLARQMPTLEGWFHYRNLDVSTLKELSRRWYPSVYKAVKKNSTHLALDDIYDSINELKHYRDNLFKS